MGNWNDSLEKKCKHYQKIQDYKLMPGGYIILHLDGRSFSKYLKRQNFVKPFDYNYIHIMNSTLKELVENVGNCRFGYVQSDEITLILSDNDGQSDLWFDNRISKITSIAAAIASVTFAKKLINFRVKDLGWELEKALEVTGTPQFDCKAWAVPSWNEAYAWVSFRSIDCHRNSTTMAASEFYSHKELLNVNEDGRVELISKAGKDWNNSNDYPNGVKYGRVAYKIQVEKSVPGKPDETFMRNVWTIEEGELFAGQEGKEKFINKNYFEIC